MAEKVVIPIDIQIKNLNAAESIGALKNGIKELTKELEKLPEGSQEFRNTAAAIGNAKDKLADMNEEIVQTTTKAGKFQAVTGILGQMANGFALAQSTMAMFGSESEAVTQSLQKVQAAMGFVQAIKELEGIADAFKNFKTVVVDFAKSGISALRSLWATMLANPITAILVGITALGAAIVYFMNQEDDETEALKRNIDAREKSIAKLEKENEAVNRAAKFRIDLAKAEGKSEQEILELEKKSGQERIKQLNLLNDEKRKNLKDLKQLIADADDDEREELVKKYNENIKLLDENKKEIQNIERDYAIKYTQFQTNQRKKEEEEQKAADEKAKELAQKRKEQREKEAEDKKKKDEEDRKRREEIAQLIKEQDDEEAQAFLEKQAAEEKAIQDRMDRLRAAADEEIRINNEKLAAQEKAEAEKEARQKLRANASLSMTEDTLKLASSMIEFYAKGDEASQKKAFEQNKKVKLALATIDLYKGVMAAFTSAQSSPFTAVFPGYPFVQASLAAAYGIMNINKIAQTQFESKASGAEQGMSAAGAGAGGAMGSPLQNGVNNTSTNLSNLAQGQQEQKPIKAYVLQTDVASEDQKMKAIENKAKIE